MIQLTRLNHETVLVNSDLIVLVEANPDTVLSLTTGEKVRVLEGMQAIVERVVEFKRLVLAGGAIAGACVVGGGGVDG